MFYKEHHYHLSSRLLFNPLESCRQRWHRIPELLHKKQSSQYGNLKTSCLPEGNEEVEMTTIWISEHKLPVVPSSLCYNWSFGHFVMLTIKRYITYLYDHKSEIHKSCHRMFQFSSFNYKTRASMSAVNCSVLPLETQALQLVWMQN